MSNEAESALKSFSTAVLCKKYRVTPRQLGFIAGKVCKALDRVKEGPEFGKLMCLQHPHIVERVIRENNIHQQTWVDRLADKIDIDKLMGIAMWAVMVSGIAAFIYWGWL